MTKNQLQRSKHPVTFSIEIAFLLLFQMALFTSCLSLSSDKRPEGVVVERNKQTRPVWADAPTNKLLVNTTEVRLHYALLKQRDLPIAVKLSQTNAIKESFDLWRPGFNQRLEDFPQLKGLQSSPRTSAETSSLLDQVAHKIHGELAQIEDIYYEKVRIDNYATVPELQGVTEYFDVHTLVQIIPVDGEKLRSALGTALGSAKIPEMRKVGKELLLSAKNKTAK